MDVKQKLAEFRQRLAAISDKVDEQNASQKALRSRNNTGSTDVTGIKTTEPVKSGEKGTNAQGEINVKVKGKAASDATKSEYESAGKMSPTSY